jgi:hypothetical protein
LQANDEGDREDGQAPAAAQVTVSIKYEVTGFDAAGCILASSGDFRFCFVP